MTLQRRLAVAVAALLVTLVVAGGLVLLSQRRYVTRQLDAQVAALVARPQATLSLAERAAAGARGGVLSEVWIGTVAPTGAVTTVLAPAGDPGLLPRVAPGEVLRVPVGRSTRGMKGARRVTRCRLVAASSGGRRRRALALLR